jgi:sec-independent protein translocase protein TatA
MFGIGGGELILILFVVLMLFGSDKIPDIARTMGKAMAQLKNATNDIKSEIQKGAEANGLDSKSITDITGNINQEINKAKENLLKEATPVVEKAKIDIENTETLENEGPIKRQS